MDNMLGSTGKKPSSGDLDLAVDLNSVSKNDLSDLLKRHAASLGMDPNDVVKKSGISVHYRSPIVGDEENGVQVDFMFVDNLELASFLMTNDERPPFNGANRHMVLSNLSKNKGYKWSPAAGLKDRESNQLVSTDPQEITRMVLGDDATLDDIKSIPSIIAYLESHFGADTTREMLSAAEETLLKVSGTHLFGSPISESLFLEAVTAGNREGIQHMYSANKPELYSMGYFNFKYFIEHLNRHGGILDPGNSTATEKMDGMAIKFGTEEGRFFVQSSYSGRVFSSDDFKNKMKYPPAIKAFEENFDAIRDVVLPIIESYGRDVLIQAEWMHSPLALERDDRPGFVYFVATDYSTEKLGSWNTFALISVEGAPQQKIIEQLVSLNNNHTKFTTVDIEVFDPIDLSSELEGSTSAIDDIERSADVISVLTNKSRKRDDQQAKKALRASISDRLLPIQQRIYNKIVAQMRKVEGSLGDIEGFVIKVDEMLFKVNMPNFMERKFGKQTMGERVSLSSDV